MNTVERKIVYTAKQYTRTGFGHTYCFVDTYENTRLMHSIMVDRVLSNNELERFLTVFISRANKGTDVSFVDSTEKQMSALFENNKYRMASLEKTLSNKMGRDKFDIHYEKKCYYLMYVPAGYDREVQEAFHVSDFHNPLICLKMACQLGEKSGSDYRILLSDCATAIDAELLAFAINET